MTSTWIDLPEDAGPPGPEGPEGPPGSPTEMGPFGEFPNDDGATIADGVLTITPADGEHPGSISTDTQTFAGDKTFTGALVAESFSGDGSNLTNIVSLGLDDGAGGTLVSNAGSWTTNLGLNDTANAWALATDGSARFAGGLATIGSDGTALLPHINDASNAQAVELRGDFNALISGAQSILEWSGGNTGPSRYYFDQLNDYRLTGSGAGLTSVRADIADAIFGNEFGNFGLVGPPYGFGPTSDVPILSQSLANYFDNSGFHGDGSALTGVVSTSLNDGAGGTFESVDGTQWVSSLNIEVPNLISPGQGSPRIYLQSDFSALADGSGSPILQFDGTNTGPSYYYFDAADGWKLKGDGSGLTGVVSAGLNYNLGDGVFEFVNYGEITAWNSNISLSVNNQTAIIRPDGSAGFSSVEVGNGATGSFTTVDFQTVTVVAGIITSIVSNV